MGELGEHKIQTVFFIDRNAEYLQEEVPVYQLEHAPRDVDAVIISLVRNYDAVEKALRDRYQARIYTLRELIE